MQVTTTSLLDTIASLLAFFSAITFHEFAHAFSAYMLGDDTAQKAGRLTLNPLAHIDLFGMLFLFFVGFGWAKPVPMNMYNFKYPKLFAIISAFAGPISNFFLALISLYLLKYIPLNFLPPTLAFFFLNLFKSSAQMNVMLGIFNMIPIPPLDGGHLVSALVPYEWRSTYVKLLPLGMILLFILIMFGSLNGLLIKAINSVLLFLTKLVV